MEKEEKPSLTDAKEQETTQETKPILPGDNVEMTIELIHPIAMSQGLTFAIREGGRTVGSGRVASIIE